MRALLFVVSIALACGCKTGTENKKESSPAPAPSTQPVAKVGTGPRVEPVVEVGTDAAPGKPKDAEGTFKPAPYLDGATCVAAWRDGDNVTIAAGGVGWLKTFRKGIEVASVDIEGACQELAVGKDARLIALYGSGRGAVDATGSARLFSHDANSLKEVHRFEIPKSSRHQFVGVAQAGPSSIYLGSFVSKYFVEIAKHTESAGRWKATPVAKVRMAWRIASGDVDGDGSPELVVARPYGDSSDALGDALVVAESGELEMLPTTMGARGITVSPADRAIVVADGWHKNYGQVARALITRITRDESNHFVSTRLAEVEGRSGFSGLLVADLGGDGKREVLAAGDGSVVIVPIGGGPVTAINESGAASDAIAVNLDDTPGDEIVILGERPGLWYPARP